MRFADCWDRVKQVTRLNKQTELADFLNISSSNISEAKMKDRFPLHWAFKIGQEFKISTDWILTGKGLPSSEPGEKGPERSMPEEGQAYQSLDFILQEGSTYQRGTIKGYLNELAAEISRKVKQVDEQPERDKVSEI